MESVNAIRGIGKTIDQTNQIAGSISSSVQQQSTAVDEISKNVQQASVGTGKIASNIMDVTQDAADSRTAASEVLEDSNKLFQQSERLKKEIQSFLGKIRHA
jgi:methyl-accepting chemotaxis protein